MKRLYTLSIIALVSLTLLSGCGSDQEKKESVNKVNEDINTETVKDDQNEKVLNEEEEVNNDDSEKTNLKTVKLSAQDAYEKYSEKYSDTALEKIALDTDYGRYVYKIKGIGENTKTEVKIDAENGDFVKEEVEDRDSSDNVATFNLSDITSLDSLIDIALSDAGSDYFLDEWELSIDDNTLILEITVQNNNGEDIEYEIDAMTGAIIDKDN
ncbi:MAG: PepSY domain-containing protein [Andreesenia angusta]|nr:PepSY domain-containing protein [Andreesenia angusta]